MIGPPLGLLLKPCKSSAREHRVDAMWRGGVSRYSYVAPGGADFADRNRRDPQIELEFLACEGRHCGKRVGRGRRVGGGHRKACPVASEHEGKWPPIDGVDDRRDHSRPDHVHRLIAAVVDGFSGPDHVGEAHDPVVR